MVMGVPREYLMCVLVGSALTTVFMHPIFSGLVGVLLWLLGKVLVKNDQFFMSIWIVKKLRIGVTRGGNEGNEYLP